MGRRNLNFNVIIVRRKHLYLMGKYKRLLTDFLVYYLTSSLNKRQSGKQYSKWEAQDMRVRKLAGDRAEENQPYYAM